mmetsp:Transcript_63476/g.164746  ORF Transcript_63476/g.164746 Transcript_63476/m.164746 type:complete len:196 (+) Transcript_63476:143-730(+)
MVTAAMALKVESAQPLVCADLGDLGLRMRFSTSSDRELASDLGPQTRPRCRCQLDDYGHVDEHGHGPVRGEPCLHFPSYGPPLIPSDHLYPMLYPLLPATVAAAPPRGASSPVNPSDFDSLISPDLLVGLPWRRPCCRRLAGMETGLALDPGYAPSPLRSSTCQHPCQLPYHCPCLLNFHLFGPPLRVRSLLFGP